MRVLHIVPDIGIANGVTSVVLNYFRQMPEDIRFDVAYFKEVPDNRRADIEALGGRVFRLSTPGVKSFLKSDWDDFLRERQGEYEAVHIHAPHMACLIAPKARRYGIEKIAVHCHSTWYSLFPKNKLRNRLLSEPVKYMKVQRLACGRDAGAFWYGSKDFQVLPNAVSCDRFRFDRDARERKRTELGLQDQLVVGHLGRVSPPQKNHPFLIRIFAEILTKRPDATLLLIGAEETAELRELAEALRCRERVRFLGTRKDVGELLSAMDVFVFPSLYEGLPVAVVEAQASGLPVVMSDAVTDEVCCTDRIMRLSLSDPPESWAVAALDYVALERSDPYETMKSSGWDIQTSAEKLEKFYRFGVWDH